MYWTYITPSIALRGIITASVSGPLGCEITGRELINSSRGLFLNLLIKALRSLSPILPFFPWIFL